MNIKCKKKWFKHLMTTRVSYGTLETLKSELMTPTHNAPHFACSEEDCLLVL